MTGFTASLTESFTESSAEPSLWDQGAWNRDQGTGRKTGRKPGIHRLGSNASRSIAEPSRASRSNDGWAAPAASVRSL